MKAFFLAGLILTAFPYWTTPLTCPQDDPCGGNIQVIENGHKRGLLTPAASGNEICDLDLNVGWYRFVDNDGNKFKLAVKGKGQCANTGSCGTTSPITLTEPAPTTIGETKQIKGCINLIQCCLFSAEVCARYCGNQLGTVYYLTPPIACSIAYCTDAVSCSSNEHVENGVCKPSYPLLLSNPVVTADSVPNINNGQHVIFKCKVDGPEIQNAQYNIVWQKDGVTVATSTTMSTSVPATILLQELFKTQDLRAVKMGFNLVCSVSAKFVGSARESSVKYSAAFYAGLSVSPLTLLINENDAVDKYKIYLKPTVPIVCETEKPCHFDVAVGNAKFVAQNEVLTSKCGIRFDENNWNTAQTFEIAGVRDQVQDGQSEQFIRVGPATVVQDIFEMKIAREWTLMPQIQHVRVKTTNVPSTSCEGTGDPHFNSFDKNYYHYYGVGDFWLARNNDPGRTWGPIAVQSRIWTCRGAFTSASCHCGVAIREGNHVVSIDQCFWQQRDPAVKIRNIPPRVRKHTPGRLPKAFSVYKNTAGTEYKVQLPSGAAVKITVSTWGMSVYVRFSEEDRGKTEGFCGNNNGNPNDDLRGPDGMQYSKNGRSVVQPAFANSWRVLKNENLFGAAVLQTLGANDVANQLNGKFCQCTSTANEPKGTLNCPEFEDPLLVQPKAFLGNGWLRTGIDVRTKRAVASAEDSPTDQDDFDDDYDFIFDPDAVPVIPEFPTPNGVTEKAARDQCSTVLMGSPVTQSCIADGRIKQISPEIVESCVEDIRLTDDMSIAKSYQASVLQQCEESLASDVSYWKPNDTSVDGSLEVNEQTFFLQPQLPQMIAATVCPGDCSGQGECVNSTCRCTSQFTGPDCSIQSDQAPTLLTFTNGGLCDRLTRPCQTAYVVGEGFIDSEELSCSVLNEETGEEYKTLSSYQSIFEVTCKLPPSAVRPPIGDDNSKPAEHFSVRVTVDGLKFSNPLTYTTYDSSCFKCSEAGDCFQKENSCLIQNRCFANSEENPANWCQKCLPKNSTVNFSKRLDNKKPVIVSPSVLKIAEGSEVLLNLSAIDPENRSVSFRMYTDMAETNVVDGLWYWKVPDKANLTDDYPFRFRAVDICGEESNWYSPKIDIIECPCASNGRCILEEGSALGTGKYKCICDFGYSGEFCETEDKDKCRNNEEPVITSRRKLYGFKGQLFQLNITVYDPERSSVMLFQTDENNSAKIRSEVKRQWTWIVPQTQRASHTFYFVARDECGKWSNVYSPTVHVLDCSCPPNSICVRRESAGKNETDCKCKSGFRGEKCELSSPKEPPILQMRTETGLIDESFTSILLYNRTRGRIHLFPSTASLDDKDSDIIRSVRCRLEGAADKNEESIDVDRDLAARLRFKVTQSDKILLITGANTKSNFLEVMQSIAYSHTGSKVTAKNREVFCYVEDDSGMRSPTTRNYISFDYCEGSSDCRNGECKSGRKGRQCVCNKGFVGKRCNVEATAPSCTFCCGGDVQGCNRNREYSVFPVCQTCCRYNRKKCRKGNPSFCLCLNRVLPSAKGSRCFVDGTVCCNAEERSHNKCEQAYKHLPVCSRDCCKIAFSSLFSHSRLSLCGKAGG